MSAKNNPSFIEFRKNIEKLTKEYDALLQKKRINKKDNITWYVFKESKYDN